MEKESFFLHLKAMNYRELNALFVAKLKKTEGMVKKRGRHMPYVDTTNNTTIGYGRNLTGKGISDDEALMLLTNDIKEATERAKAFITNFYSHNTERQFVLIEMAFNLRGFEKFIKFKEAFESKDYDKAARELLNSKAASGEQGKGLIERYQRMARIIISGVWE